MQQRTCRPGLPLVHQLPIGGQAIAGHPKRFSGQGELAHSRERLCHRVVRCPAPDVEISPVLEAIQASLHEVEASGTPLANEISSLREELLHYVRGQLVTVRSYRRHLAFSLTESARPHGPEPEDVPS